MSVAPLNIFQRLCRQWESVHPYNAAQFVRLARTFHPHVLQASWREALGDLSLGPVECNGRLYTTHALQKDATAAVATVDPRSLQSYLSASLNQPFAESELPFRPFTSDDGGVTTLGVVYRHWLADSASIRLLLRQWLARLLRDPRLPLAAPPATAPGGYWRLAGPQTGRWSLPEALFQLPRSFSRFRQVRRIQTHGSNDHTMRCDWIPTPPGWIDGVRAAAAALGVTVNDLFLAALAQACAQHLPFRPSPQRPNLALASIVDLRPACTGLAPDTFGLYLGLSNVVCSPQHLRDLPRLARAIHAQTDHHKRTGAAPASMLWMTAALATTARLPRQKLYGYYRKHMPLAGGISNVNLTHDWPAKLHPDPLREYVRISPTGPLVPLVLTPTTLNDTCSLALTRRTAVIDETRITGIVDHVLTRLAKTATTIA